MIRTERRARLLRRVLACATLAWLMTGCGGAGGGSTPPDNGGGTPPAESAWLLAEFVAGDANNQSVRVWDPAHPAVAIQDVRLVQGNGIVWTSSHLVFSDATRYDAATRSVTTLGHAKVFYDNGGKLYSIDLRGGQPHDPVQVSSAVDVFLPASATPMNAAGDDAWIDAQGGTHHWAIRATMSATTAPVSIQQIVAPLRDATTGLPTLFFVSLGSHIGSHTVPTTYEIADTSFAALPTPAVDDMTSADGWVGLDPAQAGLGYLRVAGQVRELHWGNGSASVDDAGVYTFNGHAGATLADAQAAYFCDGDDLHALAGGVARLVGTYSVAPTTLVDSGSAVAALEGTGLVSTDVSYQLEAMDKTSGTVILVEPTSTTLRVFGADGNTLILAGTPEQGPAFVTVAGGGGGTRSTVGAQSIGVVRAATAHVDQPAAPVAMLWCAAGSVDGQCGAGGVAQTAVSGVVVQLGALASAGASVRGDAVDGLATSLEGETYLTSPGGFGDGETDHRDAWQFLPASAGSLTRITSNLP